MKHLYVITLELPDEDSVYFTSMTERDAKEVRGMMKGYSIPGTVEKITASPGYGPLKDLVTVIQDIGNG